MQLLRTYEDFVARVDELGFMSLSPAIPGIPSLGEETPPEIWHQDDKAIDPWQWKDRAAEERRCAYGCILGGVKGFVAPRMYPYFHAAFHRSSVEERWDAGLLSPLALRVWRLFDGRRSIGTRELRLLAGDTSARLDRVLVDLQRTYDLTVCGHEFRTSRDGTPFGWPSNSYMRTLEWAPAAWWEEGRRIDAREASARILEEASGFGTGVDPHALAIRWGLSVPPTPRGGATR
jgi:hypothetical protein